MRKLMVMMLVTMMIFMATGCGTEQEVVADEPEGEVVQNEEKQESEIQDWVYDEQSKTLYLNADIGGFEPDAENEAGTTTNAPWANYLPEIEKIEIGEGVSYIGSYAFAFCKNLKEVIVSENATALNFRCFYRSGDWENGSDIYFNFESNGLPIFEDDVFGYTWDNPNVVVSVPEGHEEHWADYLGGVAMQIEGFEQNNFDDINLDDPNSIASIFLNDMQFMTGGVPSADMQDDFSFVAHKKRSDDDSYVEFGSDDGGAYFTRGESLFYDSRNNNQAILFKFMPNDTEDLSFTIMNDNEISMKFVDGIPHHVNRHNVSEIPYSEFGPANITLEPDKWYWALMAVDGNGTYRSAVWKEEDPMIGANCTDDTGISSGAWEWTIGFGANQTLYLAEYIVFDFDSINDGNGSSANNNSGGDLGPYWEINIGGDFDIMSDMVWHEYEPQDFKIGSGDTFKGYVLKDLMELAGHASDKASVIFSEEGIDNAKIDATYDAFIVFKKNDEFLGNPFLLTIEGLWEYPIVKVQPE